MLAFLARIGALFSFLVAAATTLAQQPPIPGPTPPPLKGRVIVSMPKECLQGTVVQLLDPATGGVLATLTPNSLGIFDSGCTLPCPSKVIVKPVNPNCTFTPAQQTVTVRCCPKVTKVKFSCDCTGKGGRIVVGVPPDCVAGTTVEIFDLSGNPVVSGPLDATGLFDTG